MARHLFLGGPLEGMLIDVGDPPPAEYQPSLQLPPEVRRGAEYDSGHSWETMYVLRVLRVVRPEGPLDLRVYLAPPEAVAMHDRTLAPILARHAVAVAHRLGLVDALPQS